MMPTPYTGNESGDELLNLPKSELKLLLKKLKITGWGSSPKVTIARVILRRVEVRERYLKLVEEIRKHKHENETKIPRSR